MQAHSQWLHAIRKGVITKKKRGVKNMKYTIVFASTQLRITRLRKYPIDQKAYLGRCRAITYKATHICSEVSPISCCNWIHPFLKYCRSRLAGFLN